MSDPEYTELRIPNYSSALKLKPDIAALVGEYIGTFSSLEWRCLDMFCLLMNCNRTAAHVVLHQFTTLSHRLEVVQDLAVVVSIENDVRVPIQSIISRFIGANRFRNRVAHSQYAMKKESDDLVFVTRTTQKAKPKMYDVRKKELQSKITELENIIREIDALTGERFAESP